MTALVPRLQFLGALLVALWLWELVARQRPLRTRLRRWAAHGALFALNAALVAGLLLAAVVPPRPGLRALGLPPRALNALAFLLLDFSLYVLHWLLHTTPWLWRLHKAHHSDADVDATTGLRFHPLEVLIAADAGAALVGFAGLPTAGVLAYATALLASLLWAHANIRLPGALERPLRLLLVTPDMHRAHHSAREGERESNFGFVLPWWDRLLGTYDPDPVDGHAAMKLGLAEVAD